MALIKCPECDLQVSDHAIACPHCGYPLQTTAAKKQRTKQRRRKKLPNGLARYLKSKLVIYTNLSVQWLLLEKTFTADQFVNCSNPLHSSRLTMRLMLH